MMPYLLLGCGTGRSGTASLARLLDGCRGTWVTHEQKPVLPWRYDPRYLTNRILYWRSLDTPFVGDVASWNLHYIEPLLQYFPALRAICLERPKDEVVESWERKTPTWNHVQHPDSWRADWDVDDKFVDSFPKFMADSKREALELYWHLYRDEIRRLQRRHPANVAIFDMGWALNTREGQDAIFEHAGIPPEARAYRTIHENSLSNRLDDAAVTGTSSDPLVLSHDESAVTTMTDEDEERR